MKCTTVLHGGVCHRTSTPHKSGNKMREKKKILLTVRLLTFVLRQLAEEVPGPAGEHVALVYETLLHDADAVEDDDES